MTDIIAFQGDLGQGKTLGQTAYAVQSQRWNPNLVMYTNEIIHTPYIRAKHLDLSQLLLVALFGKQFPDNEIHIALDEITSVLDARSSFDTKNKILSWLIYQARKRHARFTYTGTSAMLGDIRLRNETHYLIDASRREKGDLFNWITPRDSMQEIREVAEEVCDDICRDDDCKGPHVFNYKVWEIRGEFKVHLWDRDYWIVRPEIFYPMYDSYDIPAPSENMSKDQIDRYINRITNLGSMNKEDIELPEVQQV